MYETMHSYSITIALCMYDAYIQIRAYTLRVHTGTIGCIVLRYWYGTVHKYLSNLPLVRWSYPEWIVRSRLLVRRGQQYINDYRHKKLAVGYCIR